MAMAGPPSIVPPVAELVAPHTWRTVDVASDLHLHADDTDTFDAFAHYLRTTPADALLLLGDVFEVWIGDDAATPGNFESRCADLLRAASDRCAVYLQHGNRDFLLGSAFLARCDATALADPTALDLFDRRWLFSHGDALCLDDTDYLRFRAEVRTPAWQQAFLARPLAERRDLARGMRSESESRKHAGADYADADADAVARWLTAAGADTLVHGHTHHPADHAVAGGRHRVVLSDWDLRAEPPRAEVLRITAGGAVRVVLA